MCEALIPWHPRYRWLKMAVLERPILEPHRNNATHKRDRPLRHPNSATHNADSHSSAMRRELPSIPVNRRAPERPSARACPTMKENIRLANSHVRNHQQPLWDMLPCPLPFVPLKAPHPQDRKRSSPNRLSTARQSSTCRTATARSPETQQPQASTRLSAGAAMMKAQPNGSSKGLRGSRGLRPRT